MHCVVASPVGRLRVESACGGISAVRRTEEGLLAPPTPLLAECARQLEAYFRGELTAFDLPLHMQGTPFRMQVWQALLAIPYGETRSYGDVARMIGRSGAARAVGGANHCNPLCIIVPCHRVIGHSGALTGYGEGLDMKEYLLELERKYRHA